MKKTLVVLMCIVLTVCAAFSVSATNTPTAKLEASASQVIAGEYVTVSVSVDGCSDIAALGLEITYDKELCFMEGKWNAAAFSAGNNTVSTQLGNFNYTDGRGVVAFEVKDAEQNVVEGAGATISGVIAELKFQADGLTDEANIAVKVIPVDTNDQPVEIAQATTAVKVVTVVINDGWNFIDGTWYFYENGVKVTNDWRIDSTGWCFLDEEGKWVTNGLVQDSVGLAYITEDGYFYYDTTGWKIVNNEWYYIENGYAVKNQWRADSKGWCYLSDTGAMVTNNFVEDSVGSAYITEDGYFYYDVTGWKLVGDTWYYVENGYAVKNEWRADSIGWCYLSNTGAMVTNNFVEDSVGSAYITEDGYFYYDVTGWKLVGDTWYYVENGYAVKNEWRADSIGWCYLSDTGAMVTNNFVKDSFGLAYITEDGYFYYETNGWVIVDDEKYLIEGGYMVVSSWKQDSTGWFYLDEKGHLVADGTYTIDGKEYTFDENGYIVLSGLNYVAFGDSITFGADYSNNYKQMANPYPKLVGETLDFASVNNQGVSGAFFCENTLGFRCMTNTILGYTGDADVISVMLGVNDWSRGMTLGTPTDKTKSTIYGCINLIAEHLTTKYPDAFIFFMTPYKALKKWNVVEHDMYELSDVAEAVKEIAANYDIPVLDMYNLGNYEIEMNNAGNDGCHPSQEFMINYAAPQISEFIRKNYR